MKSIRALPILTLVACGGTEGISIHDGGDAAQSSDAPVMMMSGDGGTMDDVATSDASGGMYGTPSTTYPAYTPWMGKLANLGGPVLANPVVVTITWDGDTSRPTFEDFGDKIGTTSYWSAVVGEYGVGAITSGAQNHVHASTAPPSSMNDSAIRTFIQSNIGTLLPAWTNQTIYEVYLAKSTTLIFGNSSACQQGIGGYHDSFNNNSQTPIIYAVLPRCSTDNAVTSASSHELAEAATDPYPSAKPAWRSFEDEFLAFELWQRNNDENADSCEFFKDSFYTEQQPFPYAVQRSWSNKQGPLGHSPCQPYTTTYWNMAPLDMTDISVNLGNQIVKAKGYKAKQGQTIQVPVGFYTDGMTGAITVSAAESNPVVNPVTGRLSVSVDPMKTSGVNGEKTYVNVTVMMEGPQKVELFTVISTLNGVKHYLPLLISNE